MRRPDYRFPMFLCLVAIGSAIATAYRNQEWYGWAMCAWAWLMCTSLQYQLDRRGKS